MLTLVCLWGSFFLLLDHVNTLTNLFIYFGQQYSLMVQNGTVPLLPQSGCVLPDQGQVRWREVGWSSECHRMATWWGKEWILPCLWRSRCMYASSWSSINSVHHIWIWIFKMHTILNFLKQVILIFPQPLKCLSVCVFCFVCQVVPRFLVSFGGGVSAHAV